MRCVWCDAFYEGAYPGFCEKHQLEYDQWLKDNLRPHYAKSMSRSHNYKAERKRRLELHPNYDKEKYEKYSKGKEKYREYMRNYMRSRRKQPATAEREGK